MDNKYPLSTLARREYLYVCKDDTLSPTQIIFKALSIRDLDFIRNLPETMPNQNIVFILERGILRFINMPEGMSNLECIDALSKTIKEDIAKNIMQVSVLTPDVVEKINLNLKLSFEDKFQTDTWDCGECQRKGLDARRNCKFRQDYEDIYDPSFTVYVDGEEYKECPMFYKDVPMISDVFNSYAAFDTGVLPEIGGLYDQTEFFQYAWSATRREIRAKEAEALEK